ncbi:hypothetical protein J5O04_02585 [Corynebacterium hindlerae]|uniref:hypothetical protein n=1 Tax=Corynebacterium hindlerae TaxID=699041 RepID=UPI001AD6FB51|nr:hypothetical protein [Corynebacterium hindlerae]QTH60041.1 hypothetical protein J5O04_02585 [Corynebacterium hindlerae]
MTNRHTVRLRAVVAATIALTCLGGASLSAGLADAVPVAGLTTGERAVGTDILRIQLTQGNPADNGKPVSGLIQGVTIHLNRLAGIDPNSPEDMLRVEKAALDEVKTWPTDSHFSLVTDANGIVQFEGLSQGIYLVTSTAPSDEYREINPFLVAVPFHTVQHNSTPVAGVIVAKSHKPGNPPTFPPVVPPVVPPSEPPATPPTRPGQPQEVPSKTTPPKGPLAMTGAQVTGLVALASVLLSTGFVLIALSRKKRTPGAR